MALAQPKKTLPLRWPRRLEAGDTVALLAPASPPLSANIIPLAKKLFEGAGFRVVVGKHAHDQRGFLAGSDSARSADVNAALRNERVRALVCLRGGYGTTRLIGRIDFGALRRDPKMIVGCSDISALLAGALTQAGVPGLHGPMPQSLCDPDSPRYTWSRLFDALTGGPLSTGSILKGYREPGAKVETLRRGRASGPIVATNLSMLLALIGTPWFPSLKGSILCFEEIGSTPFRLDRALTQLISNGALDGVKGFAVGQLIHCEYKPEDAKGKQTARDVLHERLAPLGKPIVVGLPFGHGLYNATLPLGAEASLDATKGDLVIEVPR